MTTNQRIEAKYMIENRIKKITENETNDRTEMIIIKIQQKLEGKIGQR